VIASAPPTLTSLADPASPRRARPFEPGGRHMERTVGLRHERGAPGWPPPPQSQPRSRRGFYTGDRGAGARVFTFHRCASPLARGSIASGGQPCRPQQSVSARLETTWQKEKAATNSGGPQVPCYAGRLLGVAFVAAFSFAYVVSWRALRRMWPGRAELRRPLRCRRRSEGSCL
jgi:hypothetical protein